MPRDPSDQRRRESDSQSSLKRRYFIGVTGGIGAAMLAGCSTQTDGESARDDGTDGTDGTTDSGGSDGTGDEPAGTFRLLISDQPVAIDDFDSLNVSFDRARVFRANAEDGDEEETEDDEDEADDSAAAEDDSTEEDDEADGNETDVEDADDVDADEEDGAEEEDEEEEEEDDGESDDGQQGFFTIDLEGSTVDLTQVVGDKAVSIFEGELSEGSYSKIELYATDVEGIVDGESVEVKIPSEKLQIVKPFEVVAGESLSFVFDINVVKRGQGNKYNLLPVVSKSGVAGSDVDVEEIEDEDDDDEDDDDEDDDDDDDDEEVEDDEEDGEEAESEAEAGETDDETAGDGGTGEQGDEAGDS